ncbi:MAG: S1C family serine protease [Candidatus Omnitrophica bacterium]|jgi:hypothetical protein|nr:S1C family serine protease [Candidatus Omnitrophota bacterium]
MMKKKKKKNKIRRYLRVSRRKIKRATPEKAKNWFIANLGDHPLILGFLLILWGNAMLGYAAGRNNLLGIVIFHGSLIVSWFVMVIVSNLLRDKNEKNLKWYFRKRFVFFTLIPPLSPLGMINLWAGARFKKVTKVILSIIFISLFTAYTLQCYKDDNKDQARNPFESIIAMVNKPKKGVLLKRASMQEIGNFKLSFLSRRKRKKMSSTDISQKCMPAVATITTKNKYGTRLGLGSGFVVSGDGVIATNFHVVESAAQVEVKIGDKTYKEAYFIKGVPDLDIALIKIKAENLPVLFAGDSDRLVNGQDIVVLGNPSGFERSVSTGVISAIRSNDKMKLLQMTAPVSPGSSGGPVLNEYGEVVGITTLASFLFSQNVNFAVPINYIKQIADNK